LFDRAGGRLRLNSAGAALVPIATELLDLARQAADAVREPPARERIVVGGIASAIAALVAPRLSRLADCADIEVIEVEDADGLRELRLGHIDIALIQEYPGDDLRRDRRLSYTVGLTDALRLILPPSWPSTTALSDVRDLPWLVNGTGTRCEHATREILAASGVEPIVVGDVTDNRLLLALVAAGHGATIVPELVLAGSALDVTISSHDLCLARLLVAVTRQSRSPATTTVLDRIVSESDGGQIGPADA
jgi:DNA-binding transcriptional LysR family regulator